MGELTRLKWAPPSVLRQSPTSAPASARTVPSNSMASLSPRRCQLAPLSTLRKMPWPAVATRMVPFMGVPFGVNERSDEDAAGDAAIDGNGFAGDGTSPLGGQEQHGVRNLMGLEHAADRGHLGVVGLDLLGREALQLGFLGVQLMDVGGFHHARVD